MLNDSRFAAITECRIHNSSLNIGIADHSSFNIRESLKENFLYYLREVLHFEEVLFFGDVVDGIVG